MLRGIPRKLYQSGNILLVNVVSARSSPQVAIMILVSESRERIHNRVMHNTYAGDIKRSVICSLAGAHISRTNTQLFVPVWTLYGTCTDIIHGSCQSICDYQNTSTLPVIG
jgi:hypothetical protein